MSEATGGRGETRERIVEVAARLLREEGAGAVTTRRVAEGAAVQAPTLYRLFGDKDGLLAAVAEHVLATYVADKAAQVAASADADPVTDLRAGWALQLDFALANPALFRLFGDPARALRSPALQAGRRVLESRVHRVAAAGRLRVGEPRAVALVEAAATGAVQVLLSTPPEQRDPTLADALLDAVLAQVLTDPPPPGSSGVQATTIAFRAVADDLDGLTEAEHRLLREWLDRVIAGADRSGR